MLHEALTIFKVLQMEILIFYSSSPYVYILSYHKCLLLHLPMKSQTVIHLQATSSTGLVVLFFIPDLTLFISLYLRCAAV